MATRTKRPKPRTTTTTSHADADRRAARALAAIDETASSQLAALSALEELAATCERAVDDGVLAREVRRLIDERRASFRRYHKERVARAVDRTALSDDPLAREQAIEVVAAAVAVLEVALGDDDGDVRGLRVRLDDLRRGGAGRPVPFFARFLAHQRR